MPEFEFKNGIIVSIPNHIPQENRIEAWAAVNWQVSVMLDSPIPLPKESNERKPYILTERGKRGLLKYRKGLRRKN